MQAQPIDNAITVTQSGHIDGIRWLYVDCDNYEHYKTLPQAVDYQGLVYGLTGWNSDRCIACYQTNAKLAFDR